MDDRSEPRVAVLGVGLIGGSIGLAARRRLGAVVAGFDPDPATLEAALASGAADTVTDSVAAACEAAEVVFCAAPVGRLPELAAAALAAAGPDTAVTDVGSTKRGIVAAVGADERFIGGHPLAGAETAGLGARPQAIDAEGHDRLMATVSGMPHAVANALVAEAAADLASGERVPEVGPSFRDATRVAGSNPAIWADIFAANSEAVADSVDAVARRLAEAAALIRAGDTEAIAAWHAAAGEDRRRLLEAERPGGPLHELRLIVANKPGTMATLALALGEAGVNIEDMALYPAPDMTSGAVSLWVAGEEQAERGAALVRQLGHSVTVVGAGG